MNAKTYAALILLIAAVCIIPVSAETVIIRADVSPSFSMTVAPGELVFPLTTVGTNDKTDGNLISVASNSGFSIKMRDGDPVGNGHLRDFDGNSQLGTLVLTNPLQVSLNGGYTSLTAVDQTIHSASTGGSFSSPIKLRQVTTAADPPLGGGHYYQMGLIVTGAANP